MTTSIVSYFSSLVHRIRQKISLRVIQRKVPKVRKTLSGKYQVIMNERQAEILKLLLGTTSPLSVRKTINDRYGREIVEPHRPVSHPEWQLGDTMVMSYIYIGLSEALPSDDLEDEDQEKD